MNTYVDIINAALQLAGHSQFSAEQIEANYKALYDLHLDTMLSKHDWLFTLEIIDITDDNKLDDEMSIGWNYQYKMPDNVINVISDGNDRSINYLSPVDSIRSGLTPPTVETYSSGRLRSNFVFTNGVLHSDNEVTRALVSIDVEPRSMEINFKMALIYKLASIFAMTLEQDRELKRELERESITNLTNAALMNKGQPADPRLRAIYDWILEFRVASV